MGDLVVVVKTPFVFILFENHEVRVVRFMGASPLLFQLLCNALLLRVLLTDPSLHGRPFCNAVNPLQQVWEGFHVFLAKAGEFPPLDPWPCPNVSD